MSLLLFFGSEAVSASVDVTGVSATSALGTVSAFGTAVITVTGVSAQSAIGTVTAGVSNAVSVTGVSVASALGSVSATGTAQTTIEGVAATGAIGDTVAAGASVTAPAGVSAVGAIGTVIGHGSALIAVTGVAATGTIGTATAGVPGDVSVTGVAAEAAIGTVTAAGTARVVVTGVSASGAMGTVTFPQAAPPVEPQETFVGGVVPWPFVFTEDAAVRVRGVRARGSIGRVLAHGDATAFVTGVEAVGVVGTAQVSVGALEAPAIPSTPPVVIGVQARPRQKHASMVRWTPRQRVQRVKVPQPRVDDPVHLMTPVCQVAVKASLDHSPGSGSGTPDAIDHAWRDLQQQIRDEDELLILGALG